MVTGIETAGLVLGAFPIILTFLEYYRNGLETLQEWWKFRTEFLSFLHEVGVQSVFFSENLEALLAPIVNSDVEMQALLNDPGGPAWRDPDLDNRLKERLPQSYAWYKLSITAIENILDSMKKRLGIKPGTTSTLELKTRGKVRWEYEFARIRFTLGKKTREKLVDRMGRYNGDLRIMLGNSERLSESRLKRQSFPLAVHYSHVRDHAHSLHQLLVSEWRCECRMSHNANLLLANKITPTSRAESNSSNSADLEFHVLLYFGENVPDMQTSRWTWHETRIKISRPLKVLPPVPDSFDSRKKKISWASELSEPLTQPSSGRQNRAGFGPPSLFTTPSQASSTTLVSSSYDADQDAAEIANLCDAISQAQKEHKCLGFLLDKKERCYTFFPVLEAAIHHRDLEIVTLEDLLKERQVVGDTSSGRVHVLSRRERLYVAVILSISLLRLHSTPWLTGTWTKKNIFFTRIKDDPSAPVDTSRLYMSPPEELDAIQVQSNQAEDKTDNAAKHLLALGIMLLELCFGKALEDNPARDLYLGKDGKPNDWTDFATARHWQKSATGEIGPDYAEAIRKCILCAFPQPYNDMSDDRFSETVHSEVVEPVKATLQHFDPNAWKD